MSGLGDILGIVGVVAAPFTGGASLALTGASMAAKTAEKNRKAAQEAQEKAAEQARLDREAAERIAAAQSKQADVSMEHAFRGQPGELDAAKRAALTGGSFSIGTLLLFGFGAIVALIFITRK